MLKTNFLLQKLQSGQPVIGTWITIPSVVTADIIAGSGVDFMIIDAEHGPISYETAQNMITACESHQVSAMMRVGKVDEDLILRALDIGVHGLQLPNINNKEQVEEIIKYAKFPPLGDRGFSPFTRAGGYSSLNARHYPAIANKNTLLAINIEGKKAIEDIETILKIDGIDIIFIGLFDLSKAYGIPGQVDHPDLLAHLARLTEKINSAGKIAGTITTSPKSLQYCLSIGMRYLVHLVDCEMLSASYRAISAEFKQLRGES